MEIMNKYYCTKKPGQVFEPSPTTILSTDPRVKCYWETHLLTEHQEIRIGEDNLPYIYDIPQPTQAELDAKALEQAKAEKIKAIDTQTASKIVALAGDVYKQLEKSAEHSILLRSKIDGTATQEDLDRIVELETIAGQVMDFKYEGNNKEKMVALVEIETTLEDALAQVEAI